MEPLSPAAIVVSSLIFTKAFEKTGEKLGEAFASGLGKFIELVRSKALPKTQAVETETENTSYAAAVQELETATEADVELANIVNKLSNIIESDPVLYEKAQATVALVKNEPSIIQNRTKFAEKIGLVVQGGEVNIENFSF